MLLSFLRSTLLLLLGSAFTLVAGQGTILDIASSTPGFATLTQAVLAANPLIATALSEGGPYST